jgi:response regulator RpfG family c-di-GMP phosphodiesterase
MQRKQPNVLVVEDEQSLLIAWEEKFKRQGLNVLTATNGRSALKIAFENHPDLVVIDLVLGSSEGLKVLKTLRENKWGNRVPVVFLNSWQDPETFNAETRYPLDDYFAYNWNLEQVVERVAQKLEAVKQM